VRYRQLGTSGLTVSVVGLGANNFGGRLDLEASRQVVDAAIDAGVTLIDTSDSYGESESVLGEILAHRRGEVVIATKFGSDLHGRIPGDQGARASRSYILRAVEHSLRRLRTDYIDLYQLHRPDGVTPLGETLATLDDLVRAGKIRYAGSSNLAGWQVADASWIKAERGYAGFVSAQNHYSLLDRRVESELVPACLAHDVSVIPYFPLANGLLTGKWATGGEPPEGSRLSEQWTHGTATPKAFAIVDGLRAFASERGRSLVEVAIGALGAQPAVGSVIAGATSAEQVRSNASAAEWLPSPEDLAAIDLIAPSRR